jgi:hypothetical protein
MGGTSFVFPNDPGIAWSIMIVLYPYITGLVAGAFVVSALYHVFHQDALKPVARLALVTSLCFCAFATVPWGGREGMIAAVIVLTLPLLALWTANRLLPL